MITRRDPSDSDLLPAQRVVVVDFDIKFTALVGFLIKLSVASIPAALIISVLSVISVAIITAIGRLIFHPF